ncbi:hypothetical protein ABMA27_010885 [Loxostege sticticalis]|uniref:Uncharacterized protein n=1 Tax=Loxostege sticticalis TaxID=481309 RepID=A0ABR3H2L1_LOXSC
MEAVTKFLVVLVALFCLAQTINAHFGYGHFGHFGGYGFGRPRILYGGGFGFGGFYRPPPPPIFGYPPPPYLFYG